MLEKKKSVEKMCEEEKQLQVTLNGILKSLQTSVSDDSYSLIDELSKAALLIQRELRKLQDEIELVSMCD